MIGIGAMTKKTWIVWALFLFVPGLVGLGIWSARKASLQNRIAQATQKTEDNPVAQEYLQMYQAWTDLPADQKAGNPWGYGSYGGSDIQKRLQEGQSDRLLADIQTLGEGFTHYPNELADVMYGVGWQQEVEGYKKQCGGIEAILIGSAFFLAGGGLILTGGFLKILAVYVMKKRAEKAEASETETAEACEQMHDNDEADGETADDEAANDDDDDEAADDAAGDDETGDDETKEIPSLPETPELQSKTEEDTPEKKDGGYFQSFRKAKRGDSSGSVDSKATSLPMKPVKSLFDGSKKTQKDSYFGWAVDSDDATELETLMTTEPLTKELTELTEEVSAIRQFAAQQQDQMRKLQDGYDWMIIRRFCLRIIRCIDNIDDRVANLQEKGEDVTVYLEDIRDELVFALEASGIEQFRPDLQMTFKGLEKYAEAVRERVFTEESDLVGCIAEVARPGYQYLVNDDDVKIVRCAQVKLYEAKQS